MMNSSPDPVFLQQLFFDEQLFLIPSEYVPARPVAEPLQAVPQTAVPVAAVPVEAPQPTPEVQEPALPPPTPVVVPPTEKPAPVQTPEPAPLRFQHQLLVLTDNPSEKDLDLLQNILKSVGLSLETIDLLDVSQTLLSQYQSLLSSKAVHHVLSFGVPLKKMGIQVFLMPYQIRPVEEINFVMVDHLKDLHEDKAKKKALWTVLKQLFTA
ncbi:hypothetical protein BWI97_16035 [Siphonobacter sp. BAB-5405]|uniref:DNA polymerase III subunit psi n=1 Tax=Siphonobacter sp. BAB-5405 TaxID=1864825 RepID=UPI000C800D67|nr:DNA polymerase III subunit psi [Siphonobacter sp. BAB-5405]PMD94675.1 hypothetical protein BWI97_16035 [Siphonobacter sp. BAB-5405]